MQDLSIVNVVGGGSVGRELDLRQVYHDFPNSEIQYEPETFAAAVIRYDSPKGTIMLYSSGKYSLAGARSPDEAREVDDLFTSQVQQMLGEDLEIKTFEVRYLVGTADLEVELDLNQVAISLGIDHTEYEPEQFPGLFYRPPGKDWFCLLFASGKAVISGVSHGDKLVESFRDIDKTIMELFENE